jgi:hypothetical protein
MNGLHDKLSNKKISKTDKYLIITGSSSEPITSKNIKLAAFENGWKDGSKSEPSAFLSKTGDAIRLPNGWILSENGRLRLTKAELLAPDGLLTPVMRSLEKSTNQINDPVKSAFVAEIVSSAKHNCNRSSIVLSWVGAVYLLYEFVLENKLVEYNAEISRRWPRQKEAASVDDMSTIKESEFLNVITHINIITKAEAKELSNCLDRRNTAGHPNSHNFKEVTVGSHIQSLIDIVFSKF